MNSLDNVIIVIPAYNPDQKLIKLVNGIIEANFRHILIVNDGSKSECNSIFKVIAKLKECTILKHDINLGKGRALKTAFNYMLVNHKDSVGVVTIDSDGQHSVEDMKKVATRLNQCSKSLVLGVRDFTAENIPFRSRFGNILTKKVFYLASGVNISDTQTGLRGIPLHFLKKLMNVSGERFEYEMNMLLECKASNIALEEVEIQTIYIEENKSSHFNPVVDSIKIYSLFLKYAFSSVSSFGVDLLLFMILSFLLKDSLPLLFPIVATIGARVISSMFNYAINKNLVFNSKSKHTLIKYYTLSIGQMLASSFGVYLLYRTMGNGEVVIKVMVDACLFLISFYIQRLWVFKVQPEPIDEVVVSD